MTDKKLRKKLRKLCRWARRHGYDHTDLFAIAPNDNHEDEWFSCFSATTTSGKKVTYRDWLKEAEL